MLANNYANLYECDFYKKQVEIYKKKQPEMYTNFERNFALTNILYTESKRHYRLNSNNELKISGHSDCIEFILNKYPYVFDTLKNISAMDEIFNSSEGLTSIQAAIAVCEEYLNKEKTLIKK